MGGDGHNLFAALYAAGLADLLGPSDAGGVGSLGFPCGKSGAPRGQRSIIVGHHAALNRRQNGRLAAECGVRAGGGVVALASLARRGGRLDFGTALHRGNHVGVVVGVAFALGAENLKPPGLCRLHTGLRLLRAHLRHLVWRNPDLAASGLPSASTNGRSWTMGLVESAADYMAGDAGRKRRLGAE